MLPTLAFGNKCTPKTPVGYKHNLLINQDHFWYYRSKRMEHVHSIDEEAEAYRDVVKGEFAPCLSLRADL